MSNAPRPSLATLVREGLLVRPGEGVRVALLFAHLLLASAIFVMGRTVRDTLFLSRFSLDALPWMFVAYGVASAITVVVYAQVADRAPRDRMIAIWSALGVATYVGTWFAVRAEQAWIYPTFYVWSEVFANLLISQFWTLANDVFDPRSAKRLFGTVGAARVLGIIVVGLVTGVVVRAIGTEQLLFVLCGMLAAVAMLALRLGREVRPAPRPARSRRKRRPPPSVLRDRYVGALALMMLLAFASLTVGDYQFKAIARETYREDALAAFFAYFYAGAGILAFVFQLVGTPRILRRFGVGAGMAVMPGVFGVASAALLAMPSLAFASAMKFADNGFQYTIHETTLQSLYVPFPAAVKVRTRAFLDAVAKPLAYGFGGVLLLLFAHPLGTVGLSWVALATTVAWIALVPFVRKRYVERLQATLRVHGLEEHDAPILDAHARTTMQQALSSDDPRHVVAALDALGDAVEPAAAAEALARLAKDSEPAIRATALQRLGTLPSDALAPVPLAHALEDGSASVRAAACGALAAREADDAVEELRARLDDDEREVRRAALCALLGHGGFEGAMIAGPRLERLLVSPDAHDRRDAAVALGSLGAGGHRRLTPLLRDPSGEVRRAATRAATTAAHPSLVPVLLERLAEHSTSGDASTALASLGPDALDALLAVFDAPETSRELRLALPRVLRQIVDERTYAAVLARVDTEDSHLRLRLFAAASKLRAALGRGPEPRERVLGWIRRERVATEQLVRSYLAVREALGTELLDESVAFRALRGQRRVLRILELRHPAESLRLVRARLGAPPLFGEKVAAARRAEALEVLDGLLEPATRGLVMPFVDDGPAAGTPLPEGAALGSDAWLRSQLVHPNPFAALVVLDALARRAHPDAARLARSAIAHPDAAVRQASVAALRDDREALTTLSEDSDPDVANAAQRALEGSGDPPMETTLEKLLALRSAPLFAELRAEDLLPLARVATVEHYEPGETLFEEEEPGESLYVVASGTVVVAHGGVRLAELGPGEALGEMSVLDGSPRSASAKAGDEGARVLCVDQETFYEVMREQGELAEGLVRVLSQRLREANERLEAAQKAGS
ncbi:MAG: MFS transporter [Sandaracinus sp.]|nr:MFS transporter [Sandaracinus sp.]